MGIMDEHLPVRVDVRDMLCAQALAVLARAAEAAPPGVVLQVEATAADVRRDVAAWAAARGWTARAAGSTMELRRP